ncbi:MAG: hypothetical protein AAF393_11075 [Pseudomonadota bacterium]
MTKTVGTSDRRIVETRITIGIAVGVTAYVAIATMGQEVAEIGEN